MYIYMSVFQNTYIYLILKLSTSVLNIANFISMKLCFIYVCMCYKHMYGYICRYIYCLSTPNSPFLALLYGSIVRSHKYFSIAWWMMLGFVSGGCFFLFSLLWCLPAYKTPDWLHIPVSFNCTLEDNVPEGQQQDRGSLTSSTSAPACSFSFFHEILFIKYYVVNYSHYSFQCSYCLNIQSVEASSSWLLCSFHRSYQSISASLLSDMSRYANVIDLGLAMQAHHFQLMIAPILSI